MDLYWGGTERRITGLTIRIFAVNAVALIILMLGVLYLGQSQNNLIEAKLETFQAEVDLVAAALAEGALDQYKVQSERLFEQPKTIEELNIDTARKMVKRMAKSMGKRIRLFDADGILIADSHQLTGPGGTIYIADLEPPDNTLYSIQILKQFTAFIISLLPDRRILPKYPGDEILNTEDNRDTKEAMIGKISLSAWLNENNRILLSAAAPIYKDDNVKGAVLLTRVAKDIEDGIVDVWFDIMRVFGGTLIVTVLLSIYLSGTIAKPLKRLARAAERIRTGHSKAEDIPDFRDRHDEIGDLSVVLKDMTDELSKRMDSIESFAADVAHELKNPLTSLKSAIETASIVKKKEDREKLLGIVMHDVDRLDRLITDISHASRLDSELSREIFKPVDMLEIFTNILDIYRNPLKRNIKNGALSNISFKTEQGINVILNAQDDENFVVLGIEMRLGQVFQNLLTNAMSFSEKNHSIKIEISRRLNAVIVTVEDEGPGIPETKLETIFERFYSERPEHEDYGRHSGLGLSICKQIIEAHQGRIFAENRKDLSGKVLGAKFTVILNKI